MHEEEIDLKEYFRIVYKRKWIILLTVMAITVIGILISFALPPVYQGSTVLLVETNKQTMPMLMMEFADMGKGDAIQTQCEIVKSRSVVEAAVRHLNLVNRPSEYNTFLKNILTYVGFGDKGWARSLIAFSESRNRKSDKNLKLPEAERFRKIVEDLQKNLSVKTLKKTDLINITVDSESPSLASDLANTIADEYIKLSLNARRGEAKSVKDFVNNQLEIRESELRDLEKLLREFKEQKGIVSLSEETKIDLEKEAEFGKALEEVRVEREALKIKVENIEKDLNEQEKLVVSSSTLTKNPILDQLKSQKIDLELKMERLISDGLTPNHPDIKKINAEISQTERKIVNEESKVFGSKVYTLNEIRRKLEGEYLESRALFKALEVKQSELEKICAQYDRKFENLPKLELEYLRIQRDIKVTEEIFVMLAKKKEESRISEAMEIGNIRIIDSSIIPIKPIKPKKALNAVISFILGIMLSLGLAFTIEFFDTSFKSAEDVEKYLSLAVLGSIPFIKKDGLADKVVDEPGEGRAARLITELDPKSPVAETYRSLRTNIQFVNIDKKIRTLLVTSAGPSEGKSTTISNLAVTYAQMGHRTLLVDCDLRKPMLHNIFHLERDRGLTNILVGGMNHKDAIVESGIDNLALLPTGPIPPNPSELLGSNKMSELLEILSREFAMILIDAPPILAVTDAAVLSPKLDGVLMVIHSEKTERESSKRAKILLDHVGANIIGVVLNGVTAGSGHGYYYYYYYGPTGEKTRSGKRKEG
ncbi:MAG: hypothetical protein CVV64_02265 [Candidatus Wallbacteria bacterium HGW-Wallbacteria-1]|jgi:tyrosine-protein kinase Etk/Wzc|uniref:non-specific protein-tyrosine kinase n=1 Tax=Candidatus Wallbacteria bacterium HGW-Wallbacteria-1 TaxID=2013854 RepID=A0A2N1PV92_9BACT|nr:MAG: hypothetical protein CVV64_02265 [Candidatus Wallbacteria bacterium HGW-Wallbacteria-1]